jgi:hypothetical protein
MPSNKARDPSFSNATVNSVLHLKRKKIKELILASGGSNGGAMASRVNNYALSGAALEKEDLQMQKRTLKLQNNVIKDENLRLKTKMAFMQQEMDKKDKDIETLSLRLH